MEYQILAADDEPELLDALEQYLICERITLRKAQNGLEALELFGMREPHLVLLDVMMPGLDGLSVLQRIRRFSRVPVIILTARNSVQDKILGLELGADDYITKPCVLLEVVARIKAQLRRNYIYQGAEKETEIRRFDLILNKQKETVTKKGKKVPLTRTEYSILKLLMQNPGYIYTKQEIIEYVWRMDNRANADTLMVHISKIRAKIEDVPGNPKMLKTIKRLGYKLERE